MFLVNHSYTPSYTQHPSLRGSALSSYSNIDLHYDYGLHPSHLPLGSSYRTPYYPDLDLDLEYAMLEERRAQLKAAREASMAQRQAREAALHAREHRRRAYAREVAARQAAMEEEEAYRAHMVRVRLHRLEELRRQEEQERISEMRQFGCMQTRPYGISHHHDSHMLDGLTLDVDTIGSLHRRRPLSRASPQPSSMTRHPVLPFSGVVELIKNSNKPAQPNRHSHTEPTVETQFVPPYLASSKPKRTSLGASPADLSGLIQTGLATFLGQQGQPEHHHQERSASTTRSAALEDGGLGDLIKLFAPKLAEDDRRQPAAKSTESPDFDLGRGLEDAFAAFLGAQSAPSDNHPIAGPSARAGPAPRIPFSAKGKWRAADSEPVASSNGRTETDDQAAAQLAADAAFAAALQAEEDALAQAARARRSSSTFMNANKSVHFAEPTSCPVPKEQSKPEVGTNVKNPTSLEDLLRARVGNAEEVDGDVLVTVNRLLQLLSPTTSPAKSTTAKTDAPASASSSDRTSSAVVPPAVPAAERSKPTAHEVLDGISSSFGDLKSGFTLPVLDFVRPASPSPSSFSSPGHPRSLTFTPTNKPVYEYEAALGKLLDQLDAVESDGDESVRVRRKELVKLVDAALVDMDRAVEGQRREQADAGKEIQTQQVDDVDDVKPEVEHQEHQEVYLDVMERDEEVQGYDVVSSPKTQSSTDRDSTATAASDNALLVDVSDDDNVAAVDSGKAANHDTAPTQPSNDILLADFGKAADTVEDATSQQNIAPPSVPAQPLDDILLPTVDASPAPDGALDISTSRSSSPAPSMDVDTSDIDTFLLPAVRVPSPLLKPNHTDTDEEAVLVREDGELSDLSDLSEQTGSEAGWSQVDESR